MSKRLIALALLTVLVALAFLPGLVEAYPLADPVFTWGNGADGDLTVNAGNTFNIHASNHPGRTCSNGGDAVVYEVIGLTANTATLRSSPAAGCLKIGDEFALLNLQGSAGTTGNYELLRIQNLSANLVTFTTNKTKFYGNNAGDDSGLGSSQHVILQRVPNYNNVTLNGNLVAKAWNGTLYGFVAFRVKGNWIGSGNINADALGYRGGTPASGSDNPPGAYQGESWTRLGNISLASNDGGGGGRNPGQTGSCTGGQGNFAGGVVVSEICSSPDGAPYGTANLNRLYLGSGAGGTNNGGFGGSGGGVVYVMASNVNFLGTITTRGLGAQNSGGGSGGSIRIEGGTLKLGVLNSTGGAGVRKGQGGVGRIALYYVNTTSWSSSNPPPYTQKISSPPTLSPTSTKTKTRTPTQTPNFGATATAISLTLTSQAGPSLTPNLNATATALSLTMTAGAATITPSLTPNYGATATSQSLTATARAALSLTPNLNATGTALALTMTAQAGSSLTPDLNATGTALAMTMTAHAGSSLTPDLNATGTALALTMTAQAETPTPDYNATATADALTATAQAETETPPTPDYNATATADALTATAQAGTPDFYATATAMWLTATAQAWTKTPTITPTFSPTATLSPTASPSITPTTSGSDGTPTPNGGGGGNGSAATITPTPGGGTLFGFSSGAVCAMTLNVYVYVDSNLDGMMAAQGEGVNALQVNFLDASFGKVGSAYAYNGKATFCVPDYLRGLTLRVDIPYLQRTGTMQAPDDNNKNQPLEMWFRLEPPTLPLYIP